jgi:uncharacterized membrane-anchored protein YhcB (DUF1043 family)
MLISEKRREKSPHFEKEADLNDKTVVELMKIFDDLQAHLAKH